jgi:Lrp/AsnC family transcriptional regulator for asnA, asnC and gidA
MDEITGLYASSGDHMILAECWLKNSEELSRFMRELNGIEGVTKTCPAIILEKIK